MNGDNSHRTFNPLSLIAIGVVVAALYFAKDFFVPLVLAALISFLLAPLIRRFESWHMGRIGSVIAATLLAFAAIGGLGYIVTGQLIDLANKLPDYKTNLREKITSLKQPRGGTLDRATQTIQELTAEITESDPAEIAPPNSPPSTAKEPPVPVEVVHQADNAVTTLKNFLAPILSPLATAAIVIVFVIFMLLEREDLRDRIIHLIGHDQLHLTTQALDDAGQRVSRYLLAQFCVNASYGIPIGIGLYFLGIPNAVLWGLLATILRFIPYLGPWLAASFPVMRSLVGPGWTVPLLTIGLFVVMELVSNNVVEPWLYGASTGLSPIAVIVSAVFWTWLWGTTGLLLATPLTVCLAVIGRHVPSFGFFYVLLGDNPPIATADRLYQRLLALDEEEAVEIVEKYIELNSLAAAYDNVMLPTVRMAEQDCRSGTMDDTRRAAIYQLIRRTLGEIDETPPLPEAAIVPVLCLPASSQADELIAIMLVHLLEKRGIPARVLSSKSLASELTEKAVASHAPVICVSALPPSSTMPATYLCKRLRAQLPTGRIVVGIWGEADVERRAQRLKRVSVDAVFGTLEIAAADIAVHADLVKKVVETVAPPAETPAAVVAA